VYFLAAKAHQQIINVGWRGQVAKTDMDMARVTDNAGKYLSKVND